MANTFELIASSTVGSGGAASISFTGIASTYTDLMLMFSCRASNAANYNDTNVTISGGTYGGTGKVLYAINGTTVGTYSPGSDPFFAYVTAGNNTANTFSNGYVYIPNYNSTTNKSLFGDSVGENNGSNTILALSAGLYTSSTAINSITLTPSASATFVQYSTAYLYGVKNA
jgi:hypothetical protein